MAEVYKINPDRAIEATTGIKPKLLEVRKRRYGEKKNQEERRGKRRKKQERG